MVINTNKNYQPIINQNNMCGIILHANFSEKDNIEAPPVNESVVEQYQNQYGRGTNGFGIVLINKERDIMVKRATEPIKMLFDMHAFNAPIMLFHHRTPTSSANKISQTHPLLIDDPSLTFSYLITHNGVISNYYAMKEIHEKEGITYRTLEKTETGREEFNDSESLAIELALFIEKKIDKIRVSGSAAFAGIKINKKTNKAIALFWGRNERNPLNLSAKQGELRIASQGKGNEIEPDIITIFNLENYSRTRIPFKTAEYIWPEKTNIGFQGSSYAQRHSHSHHNGYASDVKVTKIDKTKDKSTANAKSPTADIMTMEGILDKIQKAKDSRSNNKMLGTLQSLFGDKISSDDVTYFNLPTAAGGPQNHEIFDICKAIQKGTINKIDEVGGVAYIMAHNKCEAKDILGILTKPELQKLENMQKHTEEEIDKLIDEQYLEGIIDELKEAITNPATLFTFSTRQIIAEFAETVKDIISKGKKEWVLCHQQQAEIVSEILEGFDMKLLEAPKNHTETKEPTQPEINFDIKQEDTIDKWRREKEQEDIELLQNFEETVSDRPEKNPIVLEGKDITHYLPTRFRIADLLKAGLKQDNTDEDLLVPTVPVFSGKSASHPTREKSKIDTCDLPPKKKGKMVNAFF